MADPGNPTWTLRAAAQGTLGVALVAAVFSCTVAALMIVTWARLDGDDPLHVQTVQAKSLALQGNADDEALRREIRDLDLLARRAFFGSWSFLNAGVFLLLGGVLVFAGAVKTRAALLNKLPVPGPETDPDPPATWAPAQWAVAAAGGALAAAALLLVLFGPPSVPSVPAAPEGGGLDARPAVATPPAPGPEAWARQWPGFRGPDGLGVAPFADPPADWDGAAGRNVRWKVSVPRPGFSSPVVWEGRVYLTGGDRAARDVFCFDADTGALAWRRGVSSPPGVAPPEVTQDTGYAAPTPAADGRVVCALFATGDLVCLDAAGEPLWQKNLGVPENPYGHGSSPRILGDLLIVQYDHGGGADLTAFHLFTGETSWRVPRDVTVSWSSPAVARHGGAPVLLVNGNPFFAAYDASSGRALWRLECMMGEVASSPAFEGSLAFAANENALLVAVDMESRKILWEKDLDLPDVSSPLAAGGRLYVPSGGGVLTCYDGKTGDELWLQEFDSGFWASPVLAAGRIYLPDRRGVTQIFAEGAPFDLVAAPALGEGVLATPAPVGRRLYVRGEMNLYCIEAQGD